MKFLMGGNIIYEQHYNEKIKTCDTSEQRAEIDEAYNYLLKVYKELYESDKTAANKNDNFLLMIALIIAGITALSLAGIFYFVYNQQENKPVPIKILEPESNKDYEALKREIEELKKRAEIQQTPQNNNSKYADVIEKSQSAMVFIQTDKGQGSGFLVTMKGDILTNYHVIKDAQYINVTPYHCETVTALVKDFDPVQDIALLKVETRANSTVIMLPPLFISTVTPQLGDEVIAMGSPRGLIDTVSNGIISGFRMINNVSLLQFTAPISPGSSGGALVNLQGNAVGMVKGEWRDGGQNLNFAVPANVLSQFLRHAINKPALTWHKQESITQTPPTPSAPPKPTPRTQTPKNSRGSRIPLPDEKGFNGLKWGTSFSSVETKMKVELEAIDDSDTLFSVNKVYNTFKANIDVIIGYRFENYRLRSILLIPITYNNAIKNAIIEELTNIYGSSQEFKRGDNEFAYLWSNEKIGIVLEHDLDSMLIQFIQFTK